LQHRVAQQQLDALIKRIAKLSSSLTSKAVAASEALQVKAAELEEEQKRAQALEEQLTAAATQTLSMQQQKQQQQQVQDEPHGIEQQGGPEDAGNERPRKRRKREGPRAWRMNTMEAMLQHMHAVSEVGPVAVKPQLAGEVAAPRFEAAGEQLVSMEGEKSGQQWAEDVGLHRPQRFFRQFAAYVLSQCSSLLSTTPNTYRIASYWDAAAHSTEGKVYL
jgi:hypothetical protein